MKLPIKIRAKKYYDPETGKPVGEDYYLIDADNIEIGYIEDDKEAAEKIVAAVNACADLSTDAHNPKP